MTSFEIEQFLKGGDMAEADKLAEALAPAPKPLYQVLARLQIAIENCRERNNVEWLRKHGARFHRLAQRYLTQGSGVEKLYTLESSSRNKLRFKVRFAQFDGQGHRTSDTEHDITVKPDLAFGFRLRVTGASNRNGANDVIHEDFDNALRTLIDEQEGT